MLRVMRRYAGSSVTRVFLAAVFLAATSSVAQAALPPHELMEKLAVHAAAFEAMRTRASFAFDGRLDDLDGDGKASSDKKLTARVEANGTAAHLVVIKYLEDNEDKTDEARKKAHEADEKRKAKSAEQLEKEKIRMPFLATEQAKYSFDEVEVDRADAARVRISFVPKSPSEQTIEGSAWVDTNAGTVVSAGFKVSKTPIFVDWIHFTVEFGETTALGPAISKVTTEGRGGILFPQALRRLGDDHRLPHHALTPRLSRATRGRAPHPLHRSTRRTPAWRVLGYRSGES